ncbi:MAG: heat shock protein HslJ [Metakosakonia sp.]|nr:heat shock protein HslJ [Phytobacter sp.]MBV8874545.1 heat shock protein HslJ [Phytobacter sp.]
MKRIITLLAFGVLLSGCVSHGVSKNSVNETQLAQHRFVLETVNGQTVEKGENPAEIHFDNKMVVSGSMCNRFTGQGKLSEGTLTVKKMAMTRMMCVDAQRNALDNIIGKMLSEGAQVDLTDGQLTLTTADQTLIYTQADQAQ